MPADNFQTPTISQGNNARAANGNYIEHQQVFNRYTVLNPKNKQFPVIQDEIKIPVINSLFYGLALKSFVIIIIIIFVFMPLSVYSHIYNLQNDLTITSSQHQLGWLLVFIYYTFFSFTILLKIVFPQWAQHIASNPALTNNSFGNIQFKDIRRLTMSSNIIRNKLHIYKINKSEPILFLINSFDDMLLINDAFEGCINSGNTKKERTIHSRLINKD